MLGLYLILGMMTGLILGLVVAYKILISAIEDYAELAHDCIERLQKDEDK